MLFFFFRPSTCNTRNSPFSSWRGDACMFIRRGLLLPRVILTFRGSPFIPPSRSPLCVHSYRLYTLTDVAPSPQPVTHSLQALALFCHVSHEKSRHHRRPAPRSFRCVGCRFGHRSAFKIPVRAPRPFPERCLLRRRRRRLETSTFTLKGTHRPKTGRHRLSRKSRSSL